MGAFLARVAFLVAAGGAGATSAPCAPTLATVPRRAAAKPAVPWRRVQRSRFGSGWLAGVGSATSGSGWNSAGMAASIASGVSSVAGTSAAASGLAAGVSPRLWIAFQMRVAAVLRSVNFLTGRSARQAVPDLDQPGGGPFLGQLCECRRRC